MNQYSRGGFYRFYSFYDFYDLYDLYDLYCLYGFVISFLVCLICVMASGFSNWSLSFAFKVQPSNPLSSGFKFWIYVSRIGSRIVLRFKDRFKDRFKVGWEGAGGLVQIPFIDSQTKLNSSYNPLSTLQTAPPHTITQRWPCQGENISHL